VTASKASAAMAAATHKTQVLTATDFKPVIFSSSVVATSHQTQGLLATDFELMTSASGAKSKYATSLGILASIWGVAIRATTWGKLLTRTLNSSSVKALNGSVVPS